MVLLNRLARIIDIVAGTKVYDPPMTAGSRLPNNDCSNVFKPATKRRVWITSAFSSYNNSTCDLSQNYWRRLKNKQIFFFFLQFFSSEAYISTSHLGNQSSGDDNCRAKHNKIVLKPKKDGLGCIISHKHIVLMIY